MAQDEQLREALLEIQVLRDREAQALEETKVLLTVLEDINSSTTPDAATEIALERAAAAINADVACIVSLIAGEWRIVQSVPKEFVGQTITPPIDLSRKQRNIIDRFANEAWATALPPPLADQRSLLVTPVESLDENASSVLCMHKDREKFNKASAVLLKRIVQVSGQALRTVTLSSQNARLAAVIEGSSSGFAIADATKPERPLVFVNKAFEDMTGYARSEVVGNNCRFLTAEPENSPERSRLRNAVKNLTGGQFLLRNKRKDGSPFWNELTLFPVKDPDGTVSQLVATQTDATQRVMIEEEKRQAEERLRDALDHTNDAFLLLLADLSVAHANETTREMFPSGDVNWQGGTSFSDNWDIYLQSLPKSMQSQNSAFVSPDFTRLAKSDEPLPAKLPDGRQVLFRAQRTAEGAFAVSATDITALRKTEQMLRQRVAAVENANEGIGISDTGGRLIYANPSLVQLFNANEDWEILGRKWSAFYKKDEDIDPLANQLLLGSAGKAMVPKKSTTEQGLHEVTETQVENIGDIIVVRDLSTALGIRKNQVELNKQLEQSRQKEALSNLAAGVAHDFNNLLSAITGSAMLISTDDGVDDAVKGHADRIGKAGNSAARMVNRLLDLGAHDDEVAVFDLRAVLLEMEDLVATSLPASCTLTVDVGDQPIMAAGVTGDVSQVLVNLVLNARDAMGDRVGTIDVSLSTDTPKTPPQVGSFKRGSQYGCLSVADSGTGIPKDLLERIFDPYFSTKGSRGTGAGLAMVATIIERMEGMICVETEVGKGTTFHILLPLPTPEDLETDAVASDLNLSGKTVLVLDDEEHVREVVATFLESCGAEVSAVDDPALAVEVITEDPEDWDALVSDYDMPGMTGGDVVQKLREAGVDLPIFIVTALARRMSDQRISEQSVQGLFAKPIDLRHLARKISETTE